MGLNKRKLKVLIVALLMMPLLLPLSQSFIKFIPEPQLGGYVYEITFPEYNLSNFLSGNYQSRMEKYLKRTFGFRAWFIRLYNQGQYSLYKDFNLVSSMVEGKHGHLFGKQYITSHFGEDFIGRDSIDLKIEKIQLIQKYLRPNNQFILPVIAASKGTFYEEFIPDKYIGSKELSNYSYYVESFEQADIDFIDFNAWFLEIKGKKPYPLYPKLGIHWSVYGAQLAADSLARFIENKSKVDLPDFENVDYKLKKAEGDDQDIEESLNLIFKIKDQKYAYPSVSFDKSMKDTISVLLVGDSFCYTLNYTNILQNVFYDSDFWYYNDGGFKRDPITSEKELIELGENLKKYDYFILLANEAKLHSFAWNFIEDMYNLYSLDSLPVSQIQGN